MIMKSSVSVFLTKVTLCIGLLVPYGLSNDPISGNIYATAEGLQQENSAPAEVQKFSALLIQQMSQTTPFSSWKDATVSYDPLGPGTHSWLVSLKHQNQPVGYLIIGAKKEGGLALIEYGLGDEPLFDSDRLPPLTEGKLEMYYGGPTLAQWRLEGTDAANPVRYYDARTGEGIPEQDANWSKRSPYSATSSTFAVTDRSRASLDQHMTTGKSFEPYDNLKWMTEPKLTVTSDNIQPLLDSRKRIVFMVPSTHSSYSFALPIFGYHVWSQGFDDEASPALRKSIYVQTSTSDSSRWIELQALLTSGDFKDYHGK